MGYWLKTWTCVNCRYEANCSVDCDCATGIFGQSPGGNSPFGSVKTQANISGAFSAGGGSVESTGFGGFQKLGSQPGIDR